MSAPLSACVAACRAVGSDDHKLILVLVNDIVRIWSLFGLKAGVKSVSVRAGLETSQYLVGASSCDGNVRIWKVASGGDGCVVSPLCCRECLGTDRQPGVLGKPRHDVAWRPSSPSLPPQLFVPADNKVLMLCPSDTDMGRSTYLQAWKISPASHDAIVAPLATCSWSPDGAWLATCDANAFVSRSSVLSLAVVVFVVS